MLSDIHEVNVILSKAKDLSARDSLRVAMFGLGVLVASACKERPALGGRGDTAE